MNKHLLGRALWLAAAPLLLFACDGPSRGSGTGTLAESVSSAVFDSTRGVTVQFRSPPGRTNSSTREFTGSRWIERPGSGPPPREGHAMAFDSVNGESVLFGGFAGTGGSNQELWTWDGGAWRLVSTGGPSARYGMPMAFDSGRGVIVTYGGNAQALGEGGQPTLSRSNQLWEWDGATGTWKQGLSRSPVSPPSLVHAAMAYDSARGQVVMFGGFSGKWLPETWEWDGDFLGPFGQWVRFTPAVSPSGRSQAAMVFDASRNVTVLFGGYDGRFRGDTWEWDGADWTERMADGPPARAGHSMVYDSARARVLLTGGSNGGAAFDDLWEWDGAGWTEATLSATAGERPLAEVFVLSF